MTLNELNKSFVSEKHPHSYTEDDHENKENNDPRAYQHHSVEDLD
jgi:hypothetical protein